VFCLLHMAAACSLLPVSVLVPCSWLAFNSGCPVNQHQPRYTNNTESVVFLMVMGLKTNCVLGVTSYNTECSHCSLIAAIQGCKDSAKLGVPCVLFSWMEMSYQALPIQLWL